MSRIVRICAFGCGLAGGIVASQGPEFSQQYRQRLGGGIDELKQVISRFDTDARAAGETLDSAITRLRANADEIARGQGVAMLSHRERLARLSAHRQQMIEAGPFSRMVLMARNADRDILNATYGDFEPAVPVTQEGVVATGAGFLVVWGTLLALGGLLRKLFRRTPPRVSRP